MAKPYSEGRDLCLNRLELLFEDILECIAKIQAFTKDLEYDQFKSEDMVVDAVIRNLEIIGEAAKIMPDAIKEKLSDIPWRKMVGLRNRVIHGYFGVDVAIIWFIITEELPGLKKSLAIGLENG